MTNYHLYANPNFVSGMARVLDLGGTLNEYNSVIDSEEADRLAIKSDWEFVGADIIAAMERFKEQNNMHDE